MNLRRAEFLLGFLVLAVLSVLHANAAHRNAGAVQQEQPPASTEFHLAGNVAEISSRFVHNLVFLAAGVNRGQPSLFQLNSTVAGSSISPERASELGLGKLQMPVLNLTGVDVALASLPQVADKNFSERVGREYEGTLGNDFLSGTVVEVDYSRQTVRLFDAASFKYAGRAMPIKLAFIAGLPTVHAKIAVAGGKPVEGDFVIDTALDQSLLISEKFAEAHKLHPHKPIASTEYGIGDGGSAVLSRVNEFYLGPYTLAQSIGVFPHGKSQGSPDPRIAGEIGGGLLRRFVVTIDYPHQQIVLDSGSEFRADEIEDMSGLTVAATGPGLKHFEVVQVWPHTPGAEDGFVKGDVIEGVNDEAAADMSLPELRALFHQPSAKYKVLVQRDSKTMTLTLQMHRLLY
jgi:hypothetical protein